MGLTGISRRLGSKTTARWRGALLAGACALVLAACTGDDGPSPMSKSMRSLSPQTVALINEKGMTTTSPLVVRIFKEESELEVWKEDSSGEFALLKTYPICRWSGELGPKVKEGDRQAPEGFYSITPGQMNANSQYHLAFDLGFPNGYDRAWGRSGSNLMVHGDCSSRGCYAMTDEQVQEIFALGRESFKGGQRTFQVQAYPFRMTADNMVRHRNNPNIAFWRMLKEGSDTFELTKAQPKVNFCGKRYVFNATPVDPNAKFDASAACPEFTQPEDLQQGLASRRSELNQRMASAGALTPTAPVKTGKDGGMHEVFIAKLANPEAKAPGSLPPIVKPPGSDYGVETNAPAPEESIALAKADTIVGLPKPSDGGTEVAIANVPMPTSRPAEAPGGTRTQIAAAQGPSGSQTTLFGGRAAGTTVEVASADSGFFSGVTRLFSREEPSAATPAPAAAATTPAAPPAPAAATAGPGGSVLVPNSVSMAPPSSSAFSLGNIGSSIGNWFSGSSTPAPQASLAPAAADVPMPPARPAVPPQASRPAAASAAAAPRPAAAPASHAGTVAQPAAAPVPTPQASTAPAYSPVPMPAAAATSASAAPELRPSVTSTTSIYAQPAGSQMLPGAGIMAPGGFSSSVQ